VGNFVKLFDVGLILVPFSGKLREEETQMLLLKLNNIKRFTSSTQLRVLVPIHPKFLLKSKGTGTINRKPTEMPDLI
jgi:hypothetical protein